MLWGFSFIDWFQWNSHRVEKIFVDRSDPPILCRKAGRQAGIIIMVAGLLCRITNEGITIRTVDWKNEKNYGNNFLQLFSANVKKISSHVNKLFFAICNLILIAEIGNVGLKCFEMFCSWVEERFQLGWFLGAKVFCENLFWQLLLSKKRDL